MKLGRLSQEEMKHVMNDAPEAAVKAILTKQDEIIAKLNLIAAAIGVAVDAPTLYAALNTTAIKAQLSEVELHN